MFLFPFHAACQFFGCVCRHLNLRSINSTWQLWMRPPYFNKQAIGHNFIQCNIFHINKPSSPLRYTAADWMFWGGASSHTQRTHRQILFSLEGGPAFIPTSKKSDTSHCTHRKDPGIDETFREWKEHEKKKKNKERKFCSFRRKDSGKETLHKSTLKIVVISHKNPPNLRWTDIYSDKIPSAGAQQD